MPAHEVRGFPRTDADAAVRVFAFTCGHIRLPTSFFLRGEEGEITIPVTCYLIDHPRALVLFDTGLGGMHQRPQGTLPTGRYDFTDDETIASRLQAIGVAPEEIQWIINSHLHHDHAGGNIHLPNATVVLQDAEWDYAYSGIDRSYSSADFDIGHKILKVRGEYDLFGDGTIVALPTPGHTPGHQSLRVRTSSGEMLLAGDCCGLRRSLDELRLPDKCHNADLYIDSLKKLRSLRIQGTRIFFSHDPEFWAGVPQSSPL